MKEVKQMSKFIDKIHLPGNKKQDEQTTIPVESLEKRKLREYELRRQGPRGGLKYGRQ
jgi:hypothetical protein